MKNKLLTAAQTVKQHLYLPLLLFLLVFTVDKIVLKFAGILLIYVLHPDFNFRKGIKKVPAFYLLLVALELVKFLLFNKDFSNGHLVAFLLGSLFWIISFLCVYQMQSIIEKTGEKIISNTLEAFFIINGIISLGCLVLAMYHSGSLNPYAVANENFGNSTGDLIKGLFMGPSYVNMMINSFFIFYFLYKSKFGYATLALVLVLLTTSNFANLVLLPVLIACFIFRKNRSTRIAIACFLAMFAFFYLFASPKNLRYLVDSIWVPKKNQQEFAVYQKKAEERDRKDSVLEANSPSHARIVHNEPVKYQSEKVDELTQRVDADSASYSALGSKYGKVESFKQTYKYLTSSPKSFILGSGVGGFSSLLAERMSGVDEKEGSRLFAYLPSYKSPDFTCNHYRIYKSIYSLPKVFHSIKHFPNSFANQLLGEYGVAGGLLFLFTYVLFFARHFTRLSYGKYLLFLLGGYLLFDYLFEYLSVVVVFELLMLCDIKKAKEQPAAGPTPHLQEI